MTGSRRPADAHGTATALAAHIGELDLLLGRARATVASFVHLLSPLRGRTERARRVLALLDDCAGQVRGLAEAVADPRASHDEGLLAACGRVETAVLRLVDPRAAVGHAHEPPPPTAAEHTPRARSGHWPICAVSNGRSSSCTPRCAARPRPRSPPDVHTVGPASRPASCPASASHRRPAGISVGPDETGGRREPW